MIILNKCAENVNSGLRWSLCCRVDGGSGAHTLHGKPFTACCGGFSQRNMHFQGTAPSRGRCLTLSYFKKGSSSLSHGLKKIYGQRCMSVIYHSVHNMQSVWKVFFSWPESKRCKGRCVCVWGGVRGWEVRDGHHSYLSRSTGRSSPLRWRRSPEENTVWVSVTI